MNKKWLGWVLFFALLIGLNVASYVFHWGYTFW